MEDVPVGCMQLLKSFFDVIITLKRLNQGFRKQIPYTY